MTPLPALGRRPPTYSYPVIPALGTSPAQPRTAGLPSVPSSSQARASVQADPDVWPGQHRQGAPAPGMWQQAGRRQEPRPVRPGSQTLTGICLFS